MQNQVKFSCKRLLALGLIIFSIIVIGGCVDSSGGVVKDNENNLKVHFIDVGQGDSIYVRLPNGESLLIDAGDVDYGDTVVKYLRTLGIEKIDYIVTTHPHADHIGGMNKVVDNFDVGNIYMPNATTTTKVFEKLLTSIEKKGLKISIAEGGKEILNDETLKIKFLAPINKDKELNNMSAVVQLKYGDITFLFTGDAEKKVETQMVDGGDDLKADVLKVGHHGSKTSSSKKFIQAVDPKYAVISCGKKNKYKHPSKEPLKLLNLMGVKIYRTDEMGTIIFTSDGENVNVDK